MIENPVLDGILGLLAIALAWLGLWWYCKRFKVQVPPFDEKRDTW
jgi:hypothetical protein